MCQRILITGNMGYVGSVLAEHLRCVYPQAYLVGIDSGWFAHCVTGNTVPELAIDVQWFRDVRSLRDEDLVGFDAIVHLAAVSNDPMGGRFEAVTEAINYRASVAVAQLAAKARVKSFVLASSCSVYGAAEDGRARTELDPINPLTAYARSKIAAEEALRQLEQQAMTITCLRFATACGMSKRLRLDLVLNDFVAAAVAAGRIEVLSDGTPWRPLIDVRDMARAIEWALGRSSDEGGQFVTVNVGADEWNYRVIDLAKAVAAAVPGTSVSVNESAAPDKRSYRVDFALYRNLAPRHQPEQTLEQSIAALRDGLINMEFDDINFRQSRLIRLKVLDQHLASSALRDDLRWNNGRGERAQ